MEIKPTIIIAWPRSMDFPLWRQFLRDNRDRFCDVIIVFTETNFGPDYTSFIIKSLAPDNCQMITALTFDELRNHDWRDAAIHQALPLVKSEWVWFTEQDFLPTDPALFWDMVYRSAEEAEVIGIKEGDRLHPACLFMKTEALNRTKQNFAIVTGAIDHFGQIQKDVENLGLKTVILANGFYHMSGLTHNCNLVFRGEQPNYKPEEFERYKRKCASVSVPRNIDFEQKLGVLSAKIK